MSYIFGNIYVPVHISAEVCVYISCIYICTYISTRIHLCIYMHILMYVYTLFICTDIKQIYVHFMYTHTHTHALYIYFKVKSGCGKSHSLMREVRVAHHSLASWCSLESTGRLGYVTFLPMARLCAENTLRFVSFAFSWIITVTLY